MKTRIAGVILASIAVSLGGLAASCGGELPGDAVAKVGDEYITVQEFDETFARESVYYGINDQTPREAYREVQRYVLENMVNNRVALAEAEARGLSVTDQEVQDEVDKYVAYYGGDQAKFEEELAKSGDTLESFKEFTREGLLRQKVYEAVTGDVTTVPEEDIAAYYDENEADYYVEPSRVVRHILIVPGATIVPSETTTSATAPVSTTTIAVAGPTEADWEVARATAQQVWRELLSGGDWEQLASQYSGDPVTKDSGGELGAVRLGDKLESFEKAAFSLELDEISEPVETPYGYEIIQVTSITVGGQKTLDEVRPEIESTLLSEAQSEAWNKWIEQKKAEVGVIYREDLRPATTSTIAEDTTTTASAEPTGGGPDPADTTGGTSPVEVTTTAAP